MEQQRQYGSQWEAIGSIAAKIGCTTETLRQWVRQAGREHGQRAGLTTSERERLKDLERENRELKRANEILRQASAHFARPRRGSLRPAPPCGVRRRPSGSGRSRGSSPGVRHRSPENAGCSAYTRKPYPEIGATEFTESLTLSLASEPRRPIRVAYTEAPQKNLRAGRGRVRRIALLTEEGTQVNLLAVSELPAETLIRGHLARWGLQENQLEHGVERWGIDHLDGRRVEEYPPDALVPNPARRRLDRMLKLSHTAEGEAWRKLVRAAPDDPERAQYERDARAAMERQKDLMVLRATVPAVAPVSATPLAGKLRRHELGHENVLDTLRTALANLESDLAVLLARRMDRPREAKKLLATIFAAPGTVHVGSRTVTVRLMPAASEAERVALRALRAFLADIAAKRLSVPGDLDRRRLAWALG